MVVVVASAVEVKVPVVLDREIVVEVVDDVEVEVMVDATRVVVVAVMPQQLQAEEYSAVPAQGEA